MIEERFIKHEALEEEVKQSIEEQALADGRLLLDFRVGREPLVTPRFQIPATFSACNNPTARTAWLINALLELEYEESRSFLEANKHLVRLIDIKPIYEKGVEVSANWDLDISRHASALAYYLFLPKAEIEDLGFMKGACTNCYYSGNGPNCSIRKKLEEKRKVKALQERRAFRAFTPAIFREASNQKLIEWKERIDGALRKREAGGRNLRSNRKRRLA
ncbi:hypothetical protein F4808DRAFT_459861 [Astrocystis sublimbata]|nr:hypothetical protein F4808DRAFT_459861 [Astrocystis sublimbata]